MRKLTTLFLLALVAMSSTALAQWPYSDCVFFSEYIEGSSYNKAVEIYNATGETIELSDLQIVLYSNGATTPTFQSFLSPGTLANGGVYVVAHPSCTNAAILAAADELSGTVNFNGDDAFELKYQGATVDVIGQIGVRPVPAYGTEPTTTANHTLVRFDTICCGDPDGSDAFDPADEWTAYASDTTTYLGSHTTNCFAVPTQGQTWGAVRNLFR